MSNKTNIEIEAVRLAMTQARLAIGIGRRESKELTAERKGLEYLAHQIEQAIKHTEMKK